MNLNGGVLKSTPRGAPADAMSLALVHEHNSRVEADALLMAEKQLVVQLQRAMEDLKKDAAKANKEAADLRAEVPVLNRTITELKDENKGLRDRLSAPSDAALVSIKTENAQLKAELKASQDKVAELEAECMECETECEQMETDLMEAKAKCADLAARLETERSAQSKSMETVRKIVDGMKKEEKKEDGPHSFEIDVKRGGDNLVHRLVVRMT